MVKYCYRCEQDTSHYNDLCRECYGKDDPVGKFQEAEVDRQYTKDRIRAEKEYKMDLETIQEIHQNTLES